MIRNITDSSLSLKISRLFAQSLFNTLELVYPSDDSGWSRTLLYARPLDSLSVSSGEGTNVLDGKHKLFTFNPGLFLMICHR